MGLFDSLGYLFGSAVGKSAASVANGVSRIALDVKSVKNLRKEIMDKKSEIQGSAFVNDIIANAITDPTHPPCYIEGTCEGLYVQYFDSSANSYIPNKVLLSPTEELTYVVGCAVFLIIQEAYPNVYDFPGRTIQQIQNGATIELVMKKPYKGVMLTPQLQFEKTQKK